MKKEAKLLSNNAVNSLLLSIEHFNRPFDRGRVEAVLIFLDHSFEMILKAAIIERGGRIREARAKQTFGFEKCVRVGLTSGQIKFLTEDQALTLQAVNGLRDAAQHHLVDVSEGHLYVLAQASVTLFRDILRSVFNISLYDYLPERVLPVSTRPPADLTALFDQEIEEIKKLLVPGSRKAIAARAKLRGLAILEGSVSGQNHQPTPGELKKLASQVRETKGWHDIFPGVASLCLNTEGEGPNISLRISKKEGVPIQLKKEDEAGTGVVAIRRVNELDYYTLSLQRLSEHVGLGRNKLLAVIKELEIQEDQEYFKVLRVGKVESKLYSGKAVKKICDELPRLNVDEIWARRRPR
jgi:hypothetical protein